MWEIGKQIVEDEDRKAEKALYALPERWPYFNCGMHGSEAAYPLGTAFLVVAQMLMPKCKVGRYAHGEGVVQIPERTDRNFPHRHCHWFACTGSKKCAKALSVLDEAIRVALEKAHESGREDGENLIVRLAKNELSLDEMNKMSCSKRRSK